MHEKLHCKGVAHRLSASVAILYRSACCRPKKKLRVGDYTLMKVSKGKLGLGEVVEIDVKGGAVVELITKEMVTESNVGKAKASSAASKPKAKTKAKGKK